MRSYNYKKKTTLDRNIDKPFCKDNRTKNYTEYFCFFPLYYYTFAKKKTIKTFPNLKKKKTFFQLSLDFENRRKFMEKIVISIPNEILTTSYTIESKLFEKFSYQSDQFFLRSKFNGSKQKSRENEQYSGNYKNFQAKYVDLRNKNFKKLDLVLNMIKSFSLISVFVLLVTSFSSRIFKKAELPIEYNPEKMSSYFKLKPEKLFFRFFQVFYESVNFSLVFFFDYTISGKKKFGYSKQNRNKNIKKTQLLFFKKNNVCRTFMYSFLDTSFLKNYKISRIENILTFLKIQFDSEKKIYWQIKEENRAKQFRRIISTLSPAFIKIAQAFASRPDVVGERVSKELQYLQDSMPFFSNEVAFNFIKEELGAQPDKIFSEISASPVAAASLGQVYKAKLDGIQVAVKVQRPGLIELLALDIVLIRFLAFLVQNILNIRTDLVAAVDEYGCRLFEELDYRKEASNMIRFRSLYGYMDMIYIPKVFLDYSSQHVLVMEWVEGDRLVNNSVKILQEDISLIEIGVRCSLVQLLEIGFLHCDPHGGNLIKTKEGKLAYIDFGLVSEIPESVRFSLIAAILHLINREYQLLAKDFTGLALIRNDDLDREILNFSLALSEVLDKSLSDFDDFTFQDATEKIFRLTIKFPFILPPYFLNNLRAIATLEGMALMADSEFKIVDVIYPYIINRLMTNPAQYFRTVLEDFLIDNYTMEPNWDRLQSLLRGPEWSEIFSDQNENFSDTILNFIISPTGSFLRKIILQDLINIIESYFLTLICYTNVKNKMKKISKRQINSTYFQPKLKSNVQKRCNVFPLIFIESKVYDLKTLVNFLKISILSSILIFTELLLRFYSKLVCKFTLKCRKIFSTILNGRKIE
nr:BC1 family protein [Cryptomonas sp.]